MADTKKSDDSRDESPRGSGRDETGTSPAGPHDKPELTNNASTPGAGTLPSPKTDGEADSSSG